MTPRLRIYLPMLPVDCHTGILLRLDFCHVGPIDGTIQKFTGNDNVGPSPGLKEHLTITLHAFSHYVAIFSRGNYLICDLQGFICLFLVIAC